MRSVLLVSAHELRTRWQAWVSLALLVAFAGGCVLIAAVGARRTGSAYQRFLVASKASDVLVSPAGTGLRGYYAALARLPSAAAVAPIVGLNVLPTGPGGRPVLASVAAAPLDHRWGHLLEIPKVLSLGLIVVIFAVAFLYARRAERRTETPEAARQLFEDEQ